MKTHEITPIKRCINLVPFSRDHHATLLFCWKLREGRRLKISMGRMAKYVEWFWKNHLHHHFQTEENLLFNDAKDEKIQQGLSEHKMIYQKVNEIMKAKTAKGYDLLSKLAEMLNNHTRFEERELFPHLEKKISEKELVEIGKKISAENNSSIEDYQDVFWIPSKST